jgi:TRAP-type C4-dicarboxylate transport system permease large subunit
VSAPRSGASTTISKGRTGNTDLRIDPHLPRNVSRLPGGLLHSNIGGCALFAATCGSSVATAATIGTVALPALEQRGYDRGSMLR